REEIGRNVERILVGEVAKGHVGHDGMELLPVGGSAGADGGCHVIGRPTANTGGLVGGDVGRPYRNLVTTGMEGKGSTCHTLQVTAEVTPATACDGDKVLSCFSFRRERGFFFRLFGGFLSRFGGSSRCTFFGRLFSSFFGRFLCSFFSGL